MTSGTNCPRRSPPTTPSSGTVRLVQSGVHEVGKKLVEEAAEAWMAAEHESAGARR